MPKKRPFSVRTLSWLALFLVATVFAVQGGEYGTSDLFDQRARRERLRGSVDSLRVAVDSLRAYRQAILEDEAVQERIAREEFGMIRPGELLYRFAEPGSEEAVDSASGSGG